LLALAINFDKKRCDDIKLFRKLFDVFRPFLKALHIRFSFKTLSANCSTAIPLAMILRTSAMLVSSNKVSA
jgi:hypothetical protein